MIEPMETGNTQSTVEFTTEYAVFEIPIHTLSIDMNLKVFDGEKIIECTRSYSMDDVRAAVSDAEENYIPEDATWTLTEKGREYLEELKRDLDMPD